MWNFWKKNRDNFLEILLKIMVPLPKLGKFRPNFCNFIMGPYCMKKFTQLISDVVCTQVRRHFHKIITKKRYGEEKSWRFVFGKPVLFTLGLRITTPYSLGILVWNFYQTFLIVSIEFWLRFVPQIHSTGFAINVLFITARSERMVPLCVKLFDMFSRWILIHLTWNLSCFVPNSVEILTWDFKKKIFWKKFSEILFKTKVISPTESCEISPYFLQFYSKSGLHWKKLHNYFHMFVSTQVRRYVHKQITKRRYEEEKPGLFVFGKPVLLTLCLGLTTPYSLGILVWNFYQTFVVVSIEFWLRFEPQIRPTGFVMNFLFITVRAERKVPLCAKLFDFFPRWILIHFTWNLSRFVPNSVEILTWNFRKKLFWANFSEILFKPRLSSTETCEFSSYFLQFYYGFVLRWKKNHTSTFICCFHPGKEACP